MFHLRFARRLDASFRLVIAMEMPTVARTRLSLAATQGRTQGGARAFHRRSGDMRVAPRPSWQQLLRPSHRCAALHEVVTLDATDAQIFSASCRTGWMYMPSSFVSGA